MCATGLPYHADRSGLIRYACYTQGSLRRSKQSGCRFRDRWAAVGVQAEQRGCSVPLSAEGPDGDPEKVSAPLRQVSGGLTPYTLLNPSIYAIITVNMILSSQRVGHTTSPQSHIWFAPHGKAAVPISISLVCTTVVAHLLSLETLHMLHTLLVSNPGP